MNPSTRGQRGASRYRRRRNASNRKKNETNPTKIENQHLKDERLRQGRQPKPQNASSATQPSTNTRRDANSTSSTSPPCSSLNSTSTAPTTPNPSCTTKRLPNSPPNPKPDDKKSKSNTIDDLIPRILHPAKPAVPGFLRLPSEIRWQIYSHLFPPRRVEILRKRDTTDPRRQNRYRLYHRARPPRRTQTQQPLARPIAGAARPLALALTCRTTYRETILQLYATTQFVFTATRAVARFLARTTPAAQAAIRHVELAHVMYNEPRLSEFRRFKHRSDLAFFDVCVAMAQTWTALRVLHVDLAVKDWPIRLQVGERWSWPLVVFGQYGEGMEYVEIRLRTGRFDDDRRREVARELEQKLMKPACFQRREEERSKQKKKARKVLTLVF
ncbi:hypothetical protein ATEIFO6365_0002072000 [Aspergillus terreus]|uniref:DUF7730 domain-containing protein n=1 Tax=Aspergillus terreus TaxID=33178 RepID=A0A5M3Z2U3_ASPTE|nr:hypothetical protein ATETN484_0008031800 [Aspergillus terreus]GFF13609.1 hypothetical protein ATEIFO6365_0002072000 [Aspergillus terreus]